MIIHMKQSFSNSTNIHNELIRGEPPMGVKNASVTYFPKKVEHTAINPLQTKVQTEQPNTEIQEKISKEMLENKVDKMNEILAPTTTSIKYRLHEELNVYYVQVLDTNSKEVLKEIPNRKFLDMYASMAELMGLVVDDKL